MAKYSYPTRQAAEDAARAAGDRASHAMRAIHCLLGEGLWDKAVTVSNAEYVARICAPLSPDGGVVLLRWKGDKGRACSDCWGIDDLLAHVREHVKGLDEESYALREIAEQIQGSRNHAYEEERRAQAVAV